MFGEFFSGVCHKENGENCSAEAVTDGRLKFLWIKWILFLNPDFLFKVSERMEQFSCPSIHPFLKGLCLQNPPEGIDPTQL